jgi:hypothetical protein
MEWDIDKLAADVRAAVELVRPLPEGVTLQASSWLGGLSEGWEDPIYVSVWPGDDDSAHVDGFYDAVCDMASDSYGAQVAWLAEQILLG